MAKRGPQSELNDRNWDDEEETEEAGIFKQATSEAMQGRVIKRAKRRGGGEDGEGKTSAFGGFGGLVKNAPPAASTMFGLGSKMSSDSKPFSFKPTSATNDSSVFSSTGGAATSPVESASSKSDSSTMKDNTYLQDLKGLNESVLAWIKQHVDKNPYIILTPIFKDYEKYFDNLKSKKTTSSNGSNSAFSSTFSSSAFGNRNNGNDAKTTTPTAALSAFAPKKTTEDLDSNKDGEKDSKKDTEGSAKAPSFAFGAGSTSNGEGFKFSTAAATTVNSGFSFGKTATSPISSGFSFGSTSLSSAATTTTTAASTGFSFGSGTTSTTTAATTFGGTSGFSFGALAAAKEASDKAGNSQGGAGGDDDEYVPPKPEVKEIKEDGSLYSKKCKLFYQKEGGWTERGVGHVHVKPLEEPKTQLLIRADTNLGNILLNINVTAALPVSRQGKNNVLLVCVPNPPLKDSDKDPKPISMLIRVKTAEEADELLAKLNERKALL